MMVFGEGRYGTGSDRGPQPVVKQEEQGTYLGQLAEAVEIRHFPDQVIIQWVSNVAILVHVFREVGSEDL